MTRRSTGFPPNVVQLIEARASESCEVGVEKICTWSKDAIHHRNARGMGGRGSDAAYASINVASNGLAICNNCHQYVHAHPNWSKRHGFIVPDYDDPLVKPVWWRSCRTVRLNDNGDLL